MITFKNYITSIIVITIIIKTGSTLIDKTNFFRLFKTISGIIILSYVILSLSACEFDKNLVADFNSIEFNSEFTDYKKEFENKLGSLIQNDLHNKYYVKLNVEIKTDMKSLTIYVRGNFESIDADEIKSYILKTYCTSDDEVILINEDT